MAFKRMNWGFKRVNWFRPPSRAETRTIVFLLAFVTGLGTLLASMGQALVANGPPPPFFVVIVPVANDVGWFAAFFEFAVTLALAIKAVLAYTTKQRRVAAGGALLSAYLSLSLALGYSGLRINTAAITSIRTACRDVMFFMIAAESADGSIVWAAANLVLFVPIAITLSYTNAAYIAGVDYRVVLATATNGLIAVFVVYYTLSGLLRAGALHAAQSANARDARERWWYRVLILVYLALWFSIFGYASMVRTLGAPSAQLYTAIVYNALLNSFTPLVLAEFLTLSRVSELTMRQELAQTETARAAAEGAIRGRRQYLGYIFHEARVPFSALVLGLDTLAADPCTAVSQLEDIALMRSSAASMQQVLNDTLDVEQMGSGLYTINPRPTQLGRLLERVRRTMLFLARRERVTLDVEMSASVPRLVFVDADRLFQVLTNLISNACKYNPHDGSGRVNVRVSTVDAPSSTNVAVSDGVHDASASLERAPEKVDRVDAALLRYGATLSSALVHVAKRMQCACCFGAPANAVMGIDDDGTATTPPRRATMPLPTPLGGDLSYDHDINDARIAFAAGAIQSGWLRIEVADNGEGISVDGRQKLFRMFSQMQDGQLQVAKGSGLGLYICHQIVQRMNGVIGAASHKTSPALPHGTVFHVEVPLYVLPATATDMGEDAADAVPNADDIIEERLRQSLEIGGGRSDASANNTRDRGSTSSSVAAAAIAAKYVSDAETVTVRIPDVPIITSSAAGSSNVFVRRHGSQPSPLPVGTAVLVVDDDVASRVFMARTLARMNPECTVHTAENGVAALDAMAKQHYDVVCIDKEMPLMDGPTAVSVMRERGFRGVIVGVTGALLEEEIATFLTSGAAAVLGKPVDLRKLQHTVRQLLLGERHSQSDGEPGGGIAPDV